MIQNFLKAVAAVGISSLCVLAMASDRVPVSKHYKAVSQLFAPAK